MDELRRNINICIGMETEEIKPKWDVYHSNHEGLGVILEYAQRLSGEVDGLNDALADLREALFETEYESDQRIAAKDIAMISTSMACEAVRLAVVALKYNESIERRKNNESGNSNRQSD